MTTQGRDREVGVGEQQTIQDYTLFFLLLYSFFLYLFI